MRLINLKKTNNYLVEKWLIKNIPELTPYQKERIRDSGMIRLAPFWFYERHKKADNIFVRISSIALAVVFCMLIIGLPFNYLYTGNWGYREISWFRKWSSACGF